MSALLLAVAMSAWAFPFELGTVPLPRPDARAFLAEADGKGAADVFVLDGRELLVYPDAGREKRLGIKLAPGTSAFDIADLGGARDAELIAVCEDRIMRYALGGEGATRPELMFSLTTQLSDLSGQPYPCVIAVEYEGEAVLALPREGSLELRGLDGRLVARFSTKPGEPTDEGYGWPFWVWPIDPPQVGGPRSIEARVTRVLELAYDLPEGLLPEQPSRYVQRQGTLLQMRDAADLDPAAWMWFPLGKDTLDKRVLFAVADDTLIRIREERLPGHDVGAGVKIGPVRRYPGTLLVPGDEPPDFNGDGFVDLLLWATPDPGMSMDSLARVVTRGTWPVRLTVHLYMPDKSRYEPEPAAAVTFRVPLVWFLVPESGAPLRRCILRDFDGDGRTDLALSAADNSFTVRLYGESGFGPDPDQVFTFPETLTAVEFIEDLDGEGRMSVGLRGENALYVLHAVE